MIIAQFKSARRCGVPLVAITTPDAGATVSAICDEVPNQYKGRDAEKNDVMLPLAKICWDIVRGMTARNEEGKTVIASLTSDGGDPTVMSPIALVQIAVKLPEKAILFVHLANRWVSEAVFIQGLWNLRDSFKVDGRTMVLLGPSIDLPPEVAGDVIVFDEPLPDAAALASIISEQHDNANVTPDEQKIVKAIEAVQGLPAFQAEQIVAMSLSKDGLDVPALWERKRRQIELTPGLKAHRDPVRFEDIGGVDVIKGFLRRILSGQAKPSAVVFIDEIEKFMAGSSGGAGDSSGVSQDQLGTLLAYMQDQQAAGCIFVGPPGTSKSMVAKAAGNEAGIPTIQLDLGAMKGSLVGASEQNLRAALKVVTSVSNGHSLWIATCNSISDLPPELRRRFTLGTFFFDLPTPAELQQIWKIHLTAYNSAAPSKGAMPDDDGWTGAEIKQCCDIAWRLGCSLSEAAKFVVPVSRSASEQLEKLRKAAERRFLSASVSGVYSRPAVSNTTHKRGARQLSQMED